MGHSNNEPFLETHFGPTLFYPAASCEGKSVLCASRPFAAVEASSYSSSWQRFVAVSFRVRRGVGARILFTVDEQRRHFSRADAATVLQLLAAGAPGKAGLTDFLHMVGDHLYVSSTTARRRFSARSQSVQRRPVADAVVIFDEETPLKLIRAIRPDVLVKAADCREEEVVGAAEFRSWGGRVALIPRAGAIRYLPT